MNLVTWLVFLCFMYDVIVMAVSQAPNQEVLVADGDMVAEDTHEKMVIVDPSRVQVPGQRGVLALPWMSKSNNRISLPRISSQRSPPLNRRPQSHSLFRSYRRKANPVGATGSSERHLRKTSFSQLGVPIEAATMALANFRNREEKQNKAVHNWQEDIRSKLLVNNQRNDHLALHSSPAQLEADAFGFNSREIAKTVENIRELEYLLGAAITPVTAPSLVTTSNSFLETSENLSQISPHDTNPVDEEVLSSKLQDYFEEPGLHSESFITSVDLPSETTNGSSFEKMFLNQKNNESINSDLPDSEFSEAKRPFSNENLFKNSYEDYYDNLYDEFVDMYYDEPLAESMPVAEDPLESVIEDKVTEFKQETRILGIPFNLPVNEFRFDHLNEYDNRSNATSSKNETLYVSNEPTLKIVQRTNITEDIFIESDHDDLFHASDTFEQEKSEFSNEKPEHLDKKQTLLSDGKQMVTSDENQKSVSDDKQTVTSDENQKSVSDDKQTVASDENQKSVSDDKQTVASDENQKSVSDDKQTVTSDENQTIISEEKPGSVPENSGNPISLSEILQGVNMELPQFLLTLKMKGFSLKEFTDKLESSRLTQSEFKKASGNMNSLLAMISETQPSDQLHSNPVPKVSHATGKISQNYTTSTSTTKSVTVSVDKSVSQVVQMSHGKSQNETVTINVLATSTPSLTTNLSTITETNVQVTTQQTTSSTSAPNVFGFRPGKRPTFEISKTLQNSTINETKFNVEPTKEIDKTRIQSDVMKEKESEASNNSHNDGSFYGGTEQNVSEYSTISNESNESDNVVTTTEENMEPSISLRPYQPSGGSEMFRPYRPMDPLQVGGNTDPAFQRRNIITNRFKSTNRPTLQPYVYNSPPPKLLATDLSSLLDLLHNSTTSSRGEELSFGFPDFIDNTRSPLLNGHLDKHKGREYGDLQTIEVDPNSLNMSTKSAIMAAAILVGVAMCVFLAILMVVLYRNHVKRTRRSAPLAIGSDASSSSTPPYYTSRFSAGKGPYKTSGFWGTLKKRFDPYSLSHTPT